MKFRLEERVKHRLVGLVVILSLMTVLLPAIMKKSNHQLDENMNLSVRLPAKPISPKVEIPEEKALFETVKIAEVDLTVRSEIAKLPQTVKAEPLQQKEKMIAVSNVKPQTNPANELKKLKSVAKTKIHESYAVQLASFSVKKNAEALVKKLRDKGYKANYNKFSGKKGDYYQVIVGKVARSEEARALQKQLAESIKLQGFVIKTGVS